MSGWDEVRRIYLPPPWDNCWVECHSNVPIGQWLDLKDAVALAQGDPLVENIEPLVTMLGGFVVAHNIPDVEGNPLTFTLRSMSSKLITAVSQAVAIAQEGGGAAVDPLAKTEPLPAP